MKEVFDMKPKILSVTLAASLAMTSFAALAVTASAASTVDLSTLTDDYEAQDGVTLTGTLGGNYKISIADGATVTLNDASINANGAYTGEWAGITPLGDATIVLEGTNTVKSFYVDYPGIYAAVNKTLTIKGTGSLTASGSDKGYGAGIGGGFYISCGNILIEGGDITATGEEAAGIGGGFGADCGSIMIKGGNITATGGDDAAGIGSGYDGACGNILIEGGAITATGGDNAAGIGCGVEGDCGNITITDGVTNVTATMGESAQYSIGAAQFGTCGTVTIGGTVTDSIFESPYTYAPPKSATATYKQVGKDYDAEFSGDTQASLWKVTVTPGADAVTELNVSVKGKSAAKPLKSETAFSGDGGIVFGVVLNGIASDFNGNFAALVNGEAVTTTVE